MRSADITFVVLTRNEADNISACLHSLLPESPKIVYDAGSDDATVSAAQACGATVYVEPWQGFVRARAAAAVHVTTPWTFMIDADERLTPELRYELHALNPPPSVVAYTVARRNWFLKKWIRGAGWWPDRLVRLFRSGKARVVGQMSAQGGGRLGDTDIHERWIPDGAGAALQAPIDHFSYPSLDAYRKKFAEYTKLESRHLVATPARAAAAWVIVPIRFLWLLFGRRGIFDGWRGVYISAASALYPAVAATKSWRLRSQMWR
ncbi:MAG: glycosyltransferase family 2 protein [Candidatus Eremiobacteraeota bacterium]|nr:glycosyltransferase family 2 protein [Candidatus Eremiobacteraeota bacterium]